MALVGWDGAFNAANYTLSTIAFTNDRATHSASATKQNIRGGAAIDLDQWYFELVPGGMGSNNSGSGICDSTWGPTTVQTLYNSVFNLTAFGYINGGSGQRLEFAGNTPARRCWLRTNGGVWVGHTAGMSPTADPGQPTSGIYFGDNTLAPAFTGYRGSGVADTVTANFGATAFEGAIPAGYSAYGAAVTFDPYNCHPNVTLSNANLTATQNAASSSWRSVRANQYRNSGLVYWEMRIDAYDSGNGIMLGMMDQRALLDSYAGSTTDSFGYQLGTGSTYQLTPANWQTVNTAGQWVHFAANLTVRPALIWARTAALPNWNNNAANNPATNVGGKSINAQCWLAGVTLPIYPLFSSLSVGEYHTIYTDTAVVHAPPSGYTSVGGTPSAPGASLRQSLVSVM